MDKIIFDYGIDECLKIINDRIEYYYTFIKYGEADIVEIGIIDELENLRDMMATLKYYQGDD